MTDADATGADPGEMIAAALFRLRGRRGGPRGPMPHGRSHGMHASPFGHGMPDAPPWAGPHGRPGGGPARMRLLEALAGAERPLSVSEIGEAIGVDQPRASRLVQQGVEHGLLQREADPDDARRTRIVLTDAGRKVARGMRGERRQIIEDALAGLTEPERAELARLLTKFADGWPQ
ncbi:MarR family winged helix-turn-helix transcriptional regulator [Microbacterium caowuchunii]|uniref:MarR family winged helix-turn-helix transcriptional regulator n=1 Tax=Microbacterium caowuchunii TaxID=2614638 RepID=UPI001CD695EB|nr:MarR family winged helix-turn-helix transcriptional regulator [Microbacterium caowuchunii]